MTVLDNLNVGLYEEDHLNVAYALVYEEDMTVLDLLNVYKEPSPGISILRVPVSHIVLSKRP